MRFHSGELLECQHRTFPSVKDVIDDAPPKSLEEFIIIHNHDVIHTPGKSDVGQVDSHWHTVSSFPLFPVVKNLAEIRKYYYNICWLNSQS